MVNLGPFIQRFREQKGMSQEELAQKAGIAPGFLSQIENGVRQPSLQTLEALTVALGIEIADLFEEHGKRLTLEAILKHLPSDVREYVMQERSTPYVILGKKVDEANIPLEAIEEIVDHVRDLMRKGKRPRVTG